MRIEWILVYQCHVLQRRPYKVCLSNQYSSFLASESPMGGLTIVISLSGKMPCQNEFLQLPYLRAQSFSTGMLVIRRIVLGRRTGAYIIA